MHTVEYLHPGQWPVHIGFTTSETAFNEEMNRLKIPGDTRPSFVTSDAAMHTFERNGSLLFIICMKPTGRRHSKEQVASLVAHEAIHVVQHMERELYVNGRFDDENAAYLLQHIVQHCLQHMWNTKRERSVEPH